MISQNKKMLEYTDSFLNKEFKIQGTDYNKNARYGAATKQKWIHLFNCGYSIASIARLFDCSYSTVRVVVDPLYAEKLRAARVEYNKKYRGTHSYFFDKKEYTKKLASRKREILTSPVISHLKTI